MPRDGRAGVALKGSGGRLTPNRHRNPLGSLCSTSATEHPLLLTEAPRSIGYSEALRSRLRRGRGPLAARAASGASWQGGDRYLPAATLLHRPRPLSGPLPSPPPRAPAQRIGASGSASPPPFTRARLRDYQAITMLLAYLHTTAVALPHAEPALGHSMPPTTPTNPLAALWAHQRIYI